MTALNFQLLNWQKTVFTDSTRFKIVAAGRRCGKSRLSAVTLLIEALNCPEGSSVMYVAPTMGQARSIIWELLHDLGRPVIKSSHVNNLEITLLNGRKILVRGADNPDSRDLPHRRPAATILKRVLSVKTVFCQFSS